MLDTYLQLMQELDKKNRIGLGIIMSTRGSTPQVPGASALFSVQGLEQGTLGGGQMEGDVLRRGRQCLAGKSVFIEEFNLEGRDEETEKASCGGRALVLIDGRPDHHRSVFSDIKTALKRREPGVLVNKMKGEEEFSLERSFHSKTRIFGSGDPPHSGLGGEIKQSFETGRPVLLEKGDSLYFLEPLFPRQRLIIAGAGHVGHAVAHLGHLLDFETIILDDRQDFATKERFQDADRIVTGDMAESLAKQDLDQDTYIVIVTRGHQFDAQVLKKCINSNAGYIGMMASRRKIKQMREAFIRKKWSTPEQFNQVHTPIGVRIGSQTVQEIAVSIAAEMVMVRNQRPGMGKNP
jgi:xanthine dehydrogenase accessory factor